MELYLSPDTDPIYNLALESYLRSLPAGDYMMVYVNSPCVVVGRNQQPEAEADLAYCRDHGIRVLRRISGGGTVYHDPGNVNYSFIRSGDSSLADGKEDLQTVIAILREMRIEATAGPRSELLVRGEKISGTASYCRAGRYIFHGTLLFDSDLPTLAKALDGDPSLRGRRIASVPSPVTNIRRHYPAYLDVQEFVSEFVMAALRVTGAGIVNSGSLSADTRGYEPQIIV